MPIGFTSFIGFGALAGGGRRRGRWRSIFSSDCADHRLLGAGR